MTTIATLGPNSTFSEIAAKTYAEQSAPGAQITLYPTFKRVFSMVGTECSIGVVPIENMLDGYISPVLDLLLHSRLTVVDEILLPIHFSFAANCSRINEVQQLYVQFVSQGQCSDFIESLPPQVKLISTESNGESFQQLLQGRPYDGAIIPSHALTAGRFNLSIENVSDYCDNKTRFIVVSEQEQEHKKGQEYKTSIVIMEGIDRPGMLSEILSAFAKRSINLLSIISRPTKESMGKYHFFIDVDGYVMDPILQETLTEARQFGSVKLLGSFPKASQ